MYTTTEVGKLT